MTAKLPDGDHGHGVDAVNDQYMQAGSSNETWQGVLHYVVRKELLTAYDPSQPFVTGKWRMSIPALPEIGVVEGTAAELSDLGWELRAKAYEAVAARMRLRPGVMPFCKMA